MSAPALAFANVGKVFPDGTVALRNVSLTVNPGELVALIGPSGCGKSTLLRVASKLTSHTAGEVRIATDNLGFVFQDATLMPWRTVRDNVELFCELHGVPKRERARASREAIELVGLTGFERHLPRALSGGMKMRVSLARSLTLRPKVFLFDEPFGSLDEITRERLNHELLRLFELERFAALFVTHSVSEAVFLSSRVAVMSPRPGRIVACIDIPFPYPRAPELRFDPEFAHVAGTVSRALRMRDPRGEESDQRVEAE
ncbi:MAG TPA: ABC transporter ATP-binding protein [Chloroflexota bacterium]|nr:ABC transporter ATP-binding protein [Chloroflexota bacterium]